MTCIHEPAELRPVALAHTLRGLLRPVDFADDVASAAQAHFIERAGGRGELLQGRFAQRWDAEHLCGALAGPAAIGVTTARELVFHVGVDDEHRDRRVGQRQPHGLQGAAVQQQRLAGAARGGNELIHDPARHTGIVVLGLLTQQDLVGWIELDAQDGLEQARRGRLERGAAGKAGSDRHARSNDGIETLQGVPPLPEAGQNALRVVRPASLGVGMQRHRQLDSERLSTLLAVKPDLAAFVGSCGDDRAALDGHRQHEAVVEVSEFPDQIHAAGRTGEPARRTAEPRLKPLAGADERIQAH